MTEWPPESHSNLKEWEEDELGLVIVGIILLIVVGVIVYFLRSEMIQFFRIMYGNIVGFIQTIGIPPESPIHFPLFVFTGCVLLYGLYIMFRDVIIPIHERIHYWIADFYGLNPEHTTKESLFMENPGVICVTTNIPVWQSTLVSAGPFVVIGIASALIILLIDGVIAGLAAFILVFNTGISHVDIHKIIRIALLPKGTRFANFKEGENEYRSEYAIPEE